jgi:hypothetical protein
MVFRFGHVPKLATLVAMFTTIHNGHTRNDRPFLSKPSLLRHLGLFLCGSAALFATCEGGFAQATGVQRLVASDMAHEDRFGYAFSIDGTRILVGAPEGDSETEDTGAAYLFERDESGEWLETAKLTASDAEFYDAFGGWVAVEGDLAIVGAPGEDSGGEDAGAVYVFERNAEGEWREVAKLQSSDIEAGDLFGAAVAISGDWLVVTSDYEDTGGEDAGAAYVFKRAETGEWEEVAKLQGSDTGEGDRFGAALCVVGNRVVVGADQNSENRGAAYVFELTEGGQWEETARLSLSDQSQARRFGYFVAADTDQIIVGAPVDADDSRTGSAYVFELDTDGVWRQMDRLEDSERRPQQAFGRSVAIKNDIAVVGTNIDLRSDSLKGAAYLFRRDESGSWTEIQKLQNAENPGFLDKFGSLVAISGDILLVGAPLEDPDGQSGPAIRSGATYVYDVGTANAIERIGEMLPSGFVLEQNYPNPFRLTTSVSFSIPQAADIRLTLIDLTGREIAVLESGRRSAGTYRVSLQMEGLPTGTYFYRLTAGDYVQTRGLVLVR